MVQYYEIAGKAVSLHPIKLHVCHVAYIAQGSKELIILCTNSTVRLEQQLAHYLSYQCLAKQSLLHAILGRAIIKGNFPFEFVKIKVSGTPVSGSP
jgi:hypothetical protein